MILSMFDLSAIDLGAVDFQVVLAIRMVVAALCGLAVGYERKFHLKAAGEKTHVIVSLASALMMEVSKYGFTDLGDADGARVAAQVVSGISFLGAGIIIKRNQNVEGLTTAAGVWMMSGIGLAIGAGMYFIGLLCTVLYIFFNFLVRQIDKKFKTYQMTYVMSVKDNEAVSRILQPYGRSKIVGYSTQKKEDSCQLEMTVIFMKKEQMEQWESMKLNDSDISVFRRLV